MDLDKKEVKPKMTSEQILKITALIVLAFGGVGALAVLIMFFMDRLLDDFLFLGIFISVVILISSVANWALLTVISNISEKLDCKKESTGDWDRKFTVLYLSGDIVKAKELLLNKIIDSSELEKVFSGGREEYHQMMVDEFYNKFGKYLKMFNILEFDFDSVKDIVKS